MLLIRILLLLILILFKNVNISWARVDCLAPKTLLESHQAKSKLSYEDVFVFLDDRAPIQVLLEYLEIDPAQIQPREFIHLEISDLENIQTISIDHVSNIHSLIYEMFNHLDPNKPIENIQLLIYENMPLAIIFSQDGIDYCLDISALLYVPDYQMGFIKRNQFIADRIPKYFKQLDEHQFKTIHWSILRSWGGFFTVNLPGVYASVSIYTQELINALLDKEFIHESDAVLDLGTGSGLIASVISYFSGGEVDASDIKLSALLSARMTAFVNRVNVKAYFSNGLNDVPDRKKYNVIVSALPEPKPISFKNDKNSNDLNRFDLEGQLTEHVFKEFRNKTYFDGRLYLKFLELDYSREVLSKLCDKYYLKYKVIKRCDGFNIYEITRKELVYDGVQSEKLIHLNA